MEDGTYQIRAASELRAPVLSLDSFTTNKIVNADGSVSYTFDFSVSWTRAEDATLYVLTAEIYEFPTFWAFTSKGFPDRPGGGGVTLSFSATDIPVGIFISSSGTSLITNIPFQVTAWSPIHGDSPSSNTVIGVVDTT
jgi:hypothetical protein